MGTQVGNPNPHDNFIFQKGEEVMKRINTLLLILAKSQAPNGKSEVTGILEEGHLAIRKFHRDMVIARCTLG